MYDGRRIDPTSSFTTLHRDLSGYNGGKTNGFNTANFILNEPTFGSHEFDVFVDLSKITGYDQPGAVQRLTTQPIPVSVAQLRSGMMRMRVVPVTIKGTGFDAGTPNAASAAEGMRTLFYGMTSLLPASVEFYPGSEYTYNASSGTPQEIFETIAGRLEWRRFVNKILRSVTKPDTYSFVPVASNNIKSLGGSFSALSASVIFYDEAAPAAAMREIGRRFSVTPANNSIPFTKATAFNQSDIPAAPIFGGACLDRIRHQPEGYTSIQDITGNNAAAFWPLPANAAAINDGLHGLIGEILKPDNTPRQAVTGGARRTMVWAELDYVAPSTGHTGGWKIRSGTLRAADVTAVANLSMAAPYASYEYRYMFEFYKKSGSTETLLNSYNVAPADLSVWLTGVKRGTFLATFDVQEAFDILRVKSIWEGNKLIFEIPAAGAITDSAVALPTAGQTLGSAVAMRWTTSGGAAQGSLGQPLQQLVLASTDHGVTWQLLAGMLETPSMTLNTDILDMGTYQFRILSTDGIRSASLDVANLVVPNRAPKVSIAMPLPGAWALPGSAWTLAADAWDLEDVTAGRTPVWTSNLQGTLGNRHKLTGIVLKPGVHTLTYSCTDSKGLAGSASVQVRIGPANAVPARVWEAYR